MKEIIFEQKGSTCLTTCPIGNKRNGFDVKVNSWHCSHECSGFIKKQGKVLFCKGDEKPC